MEEELKASKCNLSVQNTSSIKKILTNNLPKGGRYLSTKTLQKLSGANKKIGKSRKYVRNDKTGDNVSAKKKKGNIVKQKKIIKEGLFKKAQKQNKFLEKSPSLIEKESKAFEKFQQKKFKKLTKENSIGKKQTLVKSGMKKIKCNDTSPKNSKLKALKKMKKKKLAEKNDELKKTEDASKKDNDEIEREITTKKVKEEPAANVLKSRSGRIRKLRNVSEDFVISKNKEGKVSNLSSKADEVEKIEAESEPASFSLPLHHETPKKLETVKENNKSRVNTDLLQSALSESVESWFDITPVIEKKGKKSSRKIKLVPKEKESDFCYESTENKDLGSNQVDENEFAIPNEKPNHHINEEANTGNEGEQVNLEKVKQKDIEISPNSNQHSTVPSDEKHTEEEKANENEIMNKNENESSNKQEEKEEEKGEKEEEEDGEGDKSEENTSENFESKPKLFSQLNAKKVKPGNRHLMGYRKKRRRMRNLVLTKYVKNYGEKIDFGLPLNSDEKEIQEVVPPKEVSSELNIVETKLEVNDEVVKNENANNSERDFKNLELLPTGTLESESPKLLVLDDSLENQKSPKRSRSVDDCEKLESTTISLKENVESPASVPSEVIEINDAECQKISVEKPRDDEKEESPKVIIKTEEKENKVIEEVDSQKEETEIKKEEKTLEENISNKKEPKVFHKEKESEENVEMKENFKTSSENCQEDEIEGDMVKEKEEQEVPDDSVTKEGVRNQQENLMQQKPLTPEVTDSKISIKKIKGKRRREFCTFKEQDKCNERRKSPREIKLTPKLVDMIASCSSHKRLKRVSCIKDDNSEPQATATKEKTNPETEFEYSNLIRKATGCGDQVMDKKEKAKESVPAAERAVQPVGSIENYLQSKMEANASNFECSWEPGDLVWARFAGKVINFRTIHKHLFVQVR